MLSILYELCWVKQIFNLFYESNFYKFVFYFLRITNKIEIINLCILVLGALINKNILQSIIPSENEFINFLTVDYYREIHLKILNIIQHTRVLDEKISNLINDYLILLKMIYKINPYSFKISEVFILFNNEKIMDILKYAIQCFEIKNQFNSLNLFGFLYQVLKSISENDEMNQLMMILLLKNNSLNEFILEMSALEIQRLV